MFETPPEINELVTQLSQDPKMIRIGWWLSASILAISLLLIIGHGIFLITSMVGFGFPAYMSENYGQPGLSFFALVAGLFFAALSYGNCKKLELSNRQTAS